MAAHGSSSGVLNAYGTCHVGFTNPTFQIWSSKQAHEIPTWDQRWKKKMLVYRLAHKFGYNHLHTISQNLDFLDLYMWSTLVLPYSSPIRKYILYINWNIYIKYIYIYLYICQAFRTPHNISTWLCQVPGQLWSNGCEMFLMASGPHEIQQLSRPPQWLPWKLGDTSTTSSDKINWAQS